MTVAEIQGYQLKSNVTAEGGSNGNIKPLLLEGFRIAIFSQPVNGFWSSWSLDLVDYGCARTFNSRPDSLVGGASAK